MSSRGDHGAADELADGALDRREEALTVLQEAVEIRRRLAAEDPDIHQPDLAAALHDLGHELHELGRSEEAVLATKDAVRLLAPFYRRQPTIFDADMRRMMRSYLTQIAAAEQPPDAELIKPIIEEQIALARESGLWEALEAAIRAEKGNTDAGAG